MVQAPPPLLASGNNSFYIRTGDNPDNTTGCSLNNTFIYTGLVSSSVSYSDVLPKAVGCTWSIETEDSGFFTASVPSTYSGAKSCTFSAALMSFDAEDSVDKAVFDLLSNLDFDDNGKININIQEQDLEIEALWVSQVPYLWGPAIAEVRVWQ